MDIGLKTRKSEYVVGTDAMMMSVLEVGGVIIRVVVEGVRLKLRVVRGGLDSWLRLLFGLSCYIGKITTPVEQTHKHTNTQTEEERDSHKNKKREKR